ncbi:hypothetical protein HS041_21460 [Planomonospora sp. ID67723]|uniref:hypothetical protein n=1 Tax=Planomonospora sp. ID67723 TaxID=2738134 RepID=UPI0018C39FD0|nr:hypothetical protein [Planomonospora sp. ID67723]MBG0830337.1 hypothetical protein [Planomonospora sp. ID67723]
MKRPAAAAALLGLAAVTARSGSPGDGHGDGGGGVYTTIDGLRPGIDANAPINP